MSTFFMFGKYSPEALKGISSKRTTKANDISLLSDIISFLE